MTLECDKCGYAGSTGLTHGNFIYKDGDTDIHLRRTLGWCDICSALVPMEDFSEEVAVLQKLVDGAEELKTNFQKPITVCLTKTSKTWRDHRFDDIVELARWLRLARNREGTEKCLRCGSSGVRKFDGHYEWDVRDPWLEPDCVDVSAEQATGFIHPECGGEIIAEPCSIRLIRRFDPQYYSLDGIRLERASE